MREKKTWRYLAVLLILLALAMLGQSHFCRMRRNGPCRQDKR